MTAIDVKSLTAPKKSEYGILINGLAKRFGDFMAVSGIKLKIPKGKIFGMLGPNGAGKSTTINMLSTMLPPTGGSANILGYDIIKNRKQIRKIIGVCPQEIVLYELLTARENIHLIAQMHNLHPDYYKRRTSELLARMNLLDRADDLVKKYSGGMKRRVNVLMAVIHDPEVIFFDEPSAGLDPQSRRVVWDFIKDFEKQNKTIILTTHNMEEADDLCDELVIIDQGKIIAQGSPQQLKGRIGTGDIVEFRLSKDILFNRDEIVTLLEERNDITWAKSLGKERISFSALGGLKNISDYYKILNDEFGFEMSDVVIRQNTLEDVFISLTGKTLRD
ncbi:MAG: ATP-binding cassette domain-containing protein [archaeon]|nr:ATP-binding cassette domain-containing protein [archaeon]